MSQCRVRDNRVTLLSDRDIKASLDSGRIQLDPLDRDPAQLASIDVRLDRLSQLFGNHRYPAINPAADQSDLTHQVDVGPDQLFVLHPGELALGVTCELATLGSDIAAHLEGKSSLDRLGLLIHSTAGFIDPGSSGHVTLELSNTATMSILLYPGMKIGQLCFFDLSSPTEHPCDSSGLGSHYRGQRRPTPSHTHERSMRTRIGRRYPMSALPPSTPSRFKCTRIECAEYAACEVGYSPAPDSVDPPGPPVPEPADLQVPPPPEPPEPTPVMDVPQVQVTLQRNAGHEVEAGTPPVAPSQMRTGVTQGAALPGMTPCEQVTNRGETPQAVSVKCSLKERTVPAPHLFADPTPMSATDNSLTQTNVGLTTMTSTDVAFQIAADGEVASAEATIPIAAAIEVSEPAGVLDLDATREHHLFLVPDAADPAELEVLVIFMWDGAGRIAPGRLRLPSDAELGDPRILDQPTRTALGIPASLSSAWALHCPQASARQHNNGATGEWDKTFPDGLPMGLEYCMFEALRRMARRLAGGLRIASSGYIMVPDADSAVNLMVYSSRWINPEDLLSMIRERAGSEQMKDARDTMPEAPKSVPLTPVQVTQIEKLKAELGPMRKDTASKIAKAREEHEAQRDKPQVIDGYALMSPIGHRSDMTIEVHAMFMPLRILRWEPWTAGAIIEYQIRWLPTSVPTPGVGAISRTARLEHLHPAQDVEKAVGMTVTPVGGNIIDEDDFLVGLEEISPEDGE